MCVEDCFMQSPLFTHAADRIEELDAQLDSTLKDRARILAERDRTFDRMRALLTEADAMLDEYSNRVRKIPFNIAVKKTELAIRIRAELKGIGE